MYVIAQSIIVTVEKDFDLSESNYSDPGCVPLFFVGTLTSHYVYENIPAKLELQC